MEDMDGIIEEIDNRDDASFSYRNWLRGRDVVRTEGNEIQEMCVLRIEVMMRCVFDGYIHFLFSLSIPFLLQSTVLRRPMQETGVQYGQFPTLLLPGFLAKMEEMTTSHFPRLREKFDAFLIQNRPAV